VFQFRPWRHTIAVEFCLVVVLEAPGFHMFRLETGNFMPFLVMLQAALCDQVLPRRQAQQAAHSKFRL
jgi:hypothetical protein